MHLRVVSRLALPFLVNLTLLSACRNPPRTVGECRARAFSELARTIEPRFGTDGPYRPCRQTTEDPRGGGRTCSPAHLPFETVSPLPATCDRAVHDHVAAVQALVLWPDRTDEALEMLESLARNQPSDAVVQNDLAVGYFLRADRQGWPADRVRAHRAVHQALALDPDLPAARFNRALFQAAILPPGLAVGTWDDVIEMEVDSRWAAEAKERRAKLAALRDRAEATSWLATRGRLLESAARDDLEAVRALVELHPGRAQELAAEELPRLWAEGHRSGNLAPGQQRLAEAHRIANAIAERSGDRLALDAIEVILAAGGSSASAKLEELVAGHLALAEARAKSFDPDAAGAAARRAMQKLGAAGSPLAPLAEVRAIAERARNEACRKGDPDRLEAIARAAVPAGHPSLGALAIAQRGFCAGPEVLALTEYRRALGAGEGARDPALRAHSQVRVAALLMDLGEVEAAWNETAPLLGGSAADAPDRGTLLHTAAKLARELGDLDLAHQLLEAWQSAAEEALGESATAEYRTHLAVAHRDLALVQAERGRFEEALDHLGRAALFAEQLPLPILRPRQSAAEAQLVDVRDPARAIRLLTQALGEVGAETTPFIRARWLFERATLCRSLGARSPCSEDVEAGLAVIESEEAGNLSAPGAELGDYYFGRFGEIVEQYVGLLLDTGRAPETFLRIERARAYEPLTRVRELPLAPESFRRKTEGGRPLDLAGVQQSLPADTAVLSYTVLPDRLLVWVVTRDLARWQVAPLGRAEVTSWVKDIRRAIRSIDSPLDELGRPFQTLIADPLAVAGTGIERLVLIPDEELHGLPFAALWNAQTSRFLVEEMILSVAPSASLFVYSQLRDRALVSAGPPRALLVGNPAFDRDSPFARNLPSLADAEKEVRAIQAIYPEVQTLIGPEATPRRWFAGLVDSSVVHYGGHALANPRRPEKSLLLLAPEGEDPGTVDAERLVAHGPFPRTRLVVLAACSTAGGRPIGAVGLSPLVRPFFGGGVPGVVGTLWDVDSQAARVFSESFHRHFAHGSDAARALREAQLEMLAGKDPHSRVESWAGYELVGFASSPCCFPGGAN